MNIRDFKTIEKRRIYIEKSLEIKLDAIDVYPKGLEEAQFTNCENMIGATQIPLGVAGPILIKGEYAAGEYYIPLATTEAALVASVNRGSKAITQSGGATVCLENVGVTRGPVFQTSGISESFRLVKWLHDHLDDLKEIASLASSHLSLLKLKVRITGRYVYVRFYFDTAEAMGMNMVTIATTDICRYIKTKTKINCLSVAGNFDIDKKPAWLNFVWGRGKRVWAEASIPHEIIKQTLKTDAQKLYEVWLSKCMIGSVMAGAIGANAHVANVIAAIFIATGQDIAHVVEGSLGITTTKVDRKGLYISVYLPDLMLGTIGGGTGLPSQKEALSIMGINGEKASSFKLAEILAAAVLAGEVSLLASLAQGSLANAHERLALGKNK